MDLERDALVADRFRLEQELGRGGVGVVWAARHQITGRRVALKFVQQPAHARDVVRKRFILEAQAATALDHPHAVDVIDVMSVDDATLVMVMEWLEGETLGARLAAEETLSLETAATLILPVISAAGTAHEMGIVHRDLKPENVFITNKGVVKVLDFGLAKLMRVADGVTQTGVMVGTPAYMPPEQGEPDKEIDHRADIWALGAMLFEALTGGRPVEGKSVAQVVRRLLEDGIPPLEAIAPQLPADVTQLVDAMLARDVDDRLPDLRRAFEVLSQHTNIDVPTFGAPNTVDPELAPGSLRPPKSPRTREEVTLTTPGPATLDKAGTPSRRPSFAIAAVVFLGLAGAWIATRDDPAPAAPLSRVPLSSASPPPSAAPSLPLPVAANAASMAPRAPTVAPAPSASGTVTPSAAMAPKPPAPRGGAPRTPPPKPDGPKSSPEPPPPTPAPAKPQPGPKDKGGLRYDPPF